MLFLDVLPGGRVFQGFYQFSLLQGKYRGLHCSKPVLYLLEGHCIVFSRSSFRVVHPLAIELPRSLGMVVTHWNLPMHLFLKNCELEKYTHIPLVSPPGSKLHTNRDLVTLSWRSTYSCLPQADNNTCSKLHTDSDLVPGVAI